MALKNKDGQTAAEAYRANESKNKEVQEKELGEIFADFEKQLTQIEQKIEISQKSAQEVQQQLVQVTEKIDVIGDPSPSPFPDDFSIDKLIIIATLVLLVALTSFCLYQNRILHEINESETRINSILINEKVFWYDEKSQQLYLDSREKIQHWQTTKH